MIDKQTQEVQYQYNLALAELNKVMPTLLEAEEALNTLVSTIQNDSLQNQSDITELRGTKYPSKGILNTMIVTYMVLESKANYSKIEWKACQQMMNDRFFEKLKAFNKDELVKQEKLTKHLDNFIGENPDFTPEQVKNSSKACFSLCKWCFAIINYAKIARQVAPKQRLVEEMDQQLGMAKAALLEKERKLRDEEDKVDALEARYRSLKDE